MIRAFLGHHTSRKESVRLSDYAARYRVGRFGLACHTSAKSIGGTGWALTELLHFQVRPLGVVVEIWTSMSLSPC